LQNAHDPAATGSFLIRGNMSSDLDTLPTYLAIPLAALDREDNPRVRLHMLVDVAEIAVRWSVVLNLAELVYVGGGTLSTSVADAIRGLVAQPTLGKWLAMLAELARARPTQQRTPDAFVLHSLVEPLVRPRGGNVETSLYELRNHLAHGAGVSSKVARDLVDAHLPTVDALVRAVGAVTQNCDILAVEGDRVWNLRGVKPAICALDERLFGRDDGPWLVLEDRILPLQPLATFAQVRVVSPDGELVNRGDNHFAQMYTRGFDDRLTYNPLGYEDCCFSEVREVAGFRKLFQLTAAQPRQRPGIGWDAFLREARAMRGDLVGRTRELATLKEWCKAKQKLGGAWIGWVGGGPGFGKSMLMACLAVDASNGRTGVYYHRFRSGDARNSRADFLDLLRQGLHAWLSTRASSPPAEKSYDLAALEADVLARLGLISALAPSTPGAEPPHFLVIVDGIDEVVSYDPEFPALLRGLAVPGTTWIVAGRPEHGLPDRLGSERLDILFQPSLPRMSSVDIRWMLLKGLGKAAYDLVRRDQDAGDMADNPIVNRVTASADGLPLYVHLFLQDVLRGSRSLDDRTLPQGLPAYFRAMIERMGLSDKARDLPLLVSLLARAEEPLDESTLATLLLVGEAGGASTRKARVDDALAFGRMLLRRAPTPEGVEGWALYHKSFRDEIAITPGLAGVREEAAHALARLAEQWATLEGNPRNHAFRRGNGYALALHTMDGRAAVLRRLLDRNYLIARVEALGPATVRGMVEDVVLIERAGGAAIEPFLTHLAMAAGPSHPRPMVSAVVEACIATLSHLEALQAAPRAPDLPLLVRDMLLTLCNHRDAGVQAIATLGLMRMVRVDSQRPIYFAVQQRLAADALWWFLPRPARLWPPSALRWRLEPLAMLMLGVFLDNSQDEEIRRELLTVAGGLLSRLPMLRPLIWVGSGLLEKIVVAMPEDYGTVNLAELKVFKDALQEDGRFAGLLHELVGFVDPRAGTMEELRAVALKVVACLEEHPSTLVNIPFEHPLLARAIASEDPEKALELAHEVWVLTNKEATVGVIGQDFVYFLRMVSLGRAMHRRPRLDEKWHRLAVEASEHFYFKNKATFHGTGGRTYTPGCLIAVFPLLFSEAPEAGKKLMDKLVRDAWPASPEGQHGRDVERRCRPDAIMLRVIEINSVEYGTWDPHARAAALYGLEQVLARHQYIDAYGWAALGTILARMRAYFDPADVDDLLDRVDERASSRARQAMATVTVEDGIGILIGLRAEAFTVSVLGAPPGDDSLRHEWVEVLRLLVRPTTLTTTLRELAERFARLLETAVAPSGSAAPSAPDRAA
jgi:hypothetical protein